MTYSYQKWHYLFKYLIIIKEIHIGNDITHFDILLPSNINIGNDITYCNNQKQITPVICFCNNVLLSNINIGNDITYFNNYYFQIFI